MHRPFLLTGYRVAVPAPLAGANDAAENFRQLVTPLPAANAYRNAAGAPGQVHRVLD